jgi:hypothetical protein
MQEKILRKLAEKKGAKVRFFVRPNFSTLDFLVISMGFVATVTFLTGFVYALPVNAFALSKSFIYMRDHGGQGFWSHLVLSLGILSLVCTYLEYYRVHFERITGKIIPSGYEADRLLGRWVWFAIALLWGFVGGSFLVNVPFSPGAALYIPLGIFSFIISIKARDRRDDGD